MLPSYETAISPLCTAPALPSKPCQRPGQASGALLTMAVIQANQANLLKDLDQGERVFPDLVRVLHCTTDLTLCATKQAARAIGRSLAAMVATERQLWLNLGKNQGIKERDKSFPALVSPSRLFGTTVETVVQKFREAFERYILRCGYSPSTSSSDSVSGPSWRQGEFGCLCAASFSHSLGRLRRGK